MLRWTGIIYILLLAQLCQTTPSFTVCSQDSVTVNSDSSGTIKHERQTSFFNCKLSINGFENGSYISLSGVEVKKPKTDCASSSSQTLATVIINSVEYCAGRTTTVQIITLTTPTVYVFLRDSNSANFSIQYHSNGKL